MLCVCAGWQNGARVQNVWLSFPDCRASPFAWAQVQYYSTTGSGKDGPPASADPPITAEKVMAAAAASSQPSPEGNAFPAFYLSYVYKQYIAQNVSV